MDCGRSELQRRTERVWNVLPPTVDAGWIIVVRWIKILHDTLRVYGARCFILTIRETCTSDTNTSTDDFNTRVCTFHHRAATYGMNADVQLQR